MHETWQDWIGKGERIVWQGAPVRRGPWRAPNLFLFLFGAPFLLAGITIFWNGIAALRLSFWPALAGIGLMAFALPFLTAGAAMMFGPALHGHLAPLRVRYALTDRAAYIGERWVRRSLTRVELHAGEIDLHLGPPDSIWFRTERQDDGDGPSTRRVGFADIADGRAVYDLVLATFAPRA